MIGEQRNFDDSYFRMISVALTKTLGRCITWVNYFSDTKQRVVVPFYMSMAGSEKFVLDAFVDDIVSSRIELNTDQIPRGVITFNGFTTNTAEFANPNTYISKNAVINGEMKSFLQKTKGIPVKLTYDIDIVLMTEIDVYKCSEKIMNMLFNYMFMNIDYYGIKIDAVFALPDDKSIEIVREQNLDADTKKHIKFTLTVDSYYPSFYEDTDDYIICDNDDDIDWSRMCKTKPALKDPKDLSKIRAVYWKNWIWDNDLYDDDKPDGKERWNNTPKENF
jgi:hypothetical protein